MKKLIISCFLGVVIGAFSTPLISFADRTTLSYFTSIGVGTTTPFAALAATSQSQQDGLFPLFQVASTTNAVLFSVLGNGRTAIATTTSTTTTLNALSIGSNPNSTAASTTIKMGKLQLDGYSNTGVEECWFIIGTTWTEHNGACVN